jgi:stage V sporulation protein R
MDRIASEMRELQDAIERIWDIALELGLDPYPTHFEVVPASIMYEFGSYGIPGRFSHWTHGKAYHQLKTMYDYGLSKIYELVINANPAYAFLLEGNSVLQNKVVAAHVLGHCDFFKNNAYFAHTNRQMIESASISADRIRRYEFQHGQREVEEFLDAVLTIQEHIDPNLRLRRDEPQEERQRPPQLHGFAREYEDLLSSEERRAAQAQPERKPHRVPAEPEKDLLLFIMEHGAELDDWQRDVISIVRNEMIYFLPQMQTKIMNEGWASYWHTRIMRELGLRPEEHVEFAHMHAGVLATSRQRINPYYVGMKIFEDIERRWDEPAEPHGRSAGRPGGQGRSKIFEVRELENDQSFLRNYLTPELVHDLDLYVYRLEGDEWKIVEKDWEKVRDTLVTNMTNFGIPYIVVEDGDYRRNRELYLRHRFEGQELDLPWAEKTLAHLFRLWKRTVHLETVVDGEPLVLSFDGTDHSRRRAA